MAHENIVRYSELVDKALRANLVTKDGYIFNNRYEGTPKAGMVKIPVRSTEVAVSDYDKATGVDLATGGTSYIELILSQDKAVNEIIDGYDAVSVPDGIIVDRLQSAAYSLAAVEDAYSINVLETQGTVVDVRTAVTKNNVFSTIVDLRTKLSEAGVPTENRFLIVSPEVYGLLLNDSNFIKQSNLSQELVESGVIGQVVGFNVFESARLMTGNADIVDGKTTTTEMIAGHSDWCARVDEWSVPVTVNNLTNNYIGSSAVQGRKIFGAKVTNPKAVLIKRKEV